MGDFLKTKEYNKTDLEIISVDDFDGEYQTEYNERNIIREKTFNNELHSLVDQIYLNEEMNNKQIDFPDKISDSEMNSLLMRCENLIYRLKHFNDLPVVSSFCNPFDIEITDNDKDYINEGLAQCGFSKYQILKYNFFDKAYRSSINNLDPYFADTVFFSMNDPVILHIDENKEGFIIKSDIINSDPFFSKKFIKSDDNISDISSFYIVKIYFILEGLIDSQLLDKSRNIFEQFFSPLLLIELKSGENFQPEDIFKKLKKFTAISFLSYFFKNSINSSITNYSFNEILLIIESFIKSNSYFKLTNCMITIKDYSGKENIFILKFIISKITKSLKKNFLIFRISTNKIILIIPESYISDIGNIIDKVNSTDEVIKIQIINDISSKDLIDFLLH